MFSKALLNTLILVLAVNAGPLISHDSIITFSISRGPESPQLDARIAFNILKNNQARAYQLSLRTSDGWPSPQEVNERVTNVASEYYVASVGVGSPTTQYKLLVDTGSSNTWVAASGYVKTNTSQTTHSSLSIGVASAPAGFDFDGADGILGLGPVDLTVGTLSPDTTKSIPTVTDNAFSEQKIPAHEIGISFAPAQGSSSPNGEITWGYVAALSQVLPITDDEPSKFYWGIKQSITYGSTNILSLSSGIVDTGTTLILIAPDAFRRYKTATGAVVDSATGLLTITPAQYQALQNLDFHINGQTFSLTPNAQIWPRSLNSHLGSDANTIFLIVADLGNFTVSGFDFVIGLSFLERFYSVYDTANKRVGLATTPFTTATTN